MTGPDNEDPGLAAEYALGVLDAGERDSARRRLTSDPAFAAEVRAWEDRLHPLSDAVAAETPPAALWTRIATSTQSRVAAPTARGRSGLWGSLSFWRAATAGFATVAAVCLAVLVLRAPEAVPVQAPAVPPPMLVARIAPSAGAAPVMVVAYDPARRTALVTPLGDAAPAGRTHELWLMDDQGRPHSLGVVRMDKPVPHPLSDAMTPMVRDDSMLAVSVEPAGGSPSGQPTGPVVATGPLSRV